MKHLKTIVLIIVFFLSGFLIGSSYKTPTVQTPTANEQTQNAEDVSFMFVFDDTNIKTNDVPWHEGLTLFDATETVTSENDIAFESKDYGDLGILVTKIGEKINGDDDAYWQYWVNNTQIQTAANNYMLEPGDVVSWHFRRSDY